MAQAGHAIVGAESPRSGTGVGVMPWGTGVAAVETAEVALQRVAAGILGGVPPQQFMDSIYTAGQQLGNRAFLRWVREWQGEGRGQATGSLPGEVTGVGVPGAAFPVTVSGPLQLMPKKKKKKTVSAVGGESEVTTEASGGAGPGADVETLPVFGAAVSEAAVTMPHADPGVTATPGQKKKKKKSRVQVALNTLREEGVEAFKKYIEAEIGEVELLRTLVERIMRAQDLGDNKEAARRVVEARLRVLDPESVPVTAQAAEPGPGQSRAEPDKAPIRSELSIREIELIDACINGDIGKVRRLLRHVNIDINMGSEYGTPLCIASYNGRSGIVRELLSRPGIDVNLATEEGGTPLFYTVQEGYVEVIKLLLAAPGINVNLATDEGVTPLYIATEVGHVGVVELLLAVPGINVNSATLDVGAVPLSTAAVKGWEDIVRLLLDSPDIDINPRMYDSGATPLCIAAQNNFPRIVEQLVRRGADVNLAAYQGTTPLFSAAGKGNLEAVRALLQAPAIAVNLAREDGLMPLAIASQEGHKDIVRLLLRKGADPNRAHKSGLSPLQVASLNGHAGIVEMLLDAGADMDAEIEDEGQRYTPYSLAQLAGHRKIMSVLAAFRRCRGEDPVRLEGLTLTEEAGETLSIPAALPDSPGKGSLAPAETLSATTAEAPPTSVRSAEATLGTEVSSPLARAQEALRQEVLRKLEQDTLEPLEGIRILEDVRATDSLDGLCTLYNRLAGIERQQERARRRGVRHGWLAISTSTPAPAPEGADPRFALDAASELDAEGVEVEIRRHLSQRYHRFVSQAVNNMEFGRGKPTTGFPGLWHVSAGVPGVGSCSVFYYTDGTGKRIRVVGIGHHVGPAAYRLDYAAGELGRVGRILRIDMT